MKVFRLIAVLSIGLAASFSESASGEVQSVPSMTVPSLDDGSLVCFMRTEDGRTLDLGRLCGTNVGDRSNRTTAITTNVPPVTGAGEGFGANGCYGLDAQGRPCASGQ